MSALIRSSILLVALAACESAVNLDIEYTDASASDAGAEGGEAPAPGVELEACPCDETQGFGCCVTTNGPSFCTLDANQCTQEKGVFMKCFRPSVVMESVCCWHGSGVGAVVAYAGICDGGPAACVDDDDCRGAASGATCLHRPCGGQEIGQCGAPGGEPPVCP